jgi:hypothetical protein
MDRDSSSHLASCQESRTAPLARWGVRLAAGGLALLVLAGAGVAAVAAAVALVLVHMGRWVLGAIAPVLPRQQLRTVPVRVNRARYWTEDSGHSP